LKAIITLLKFLVLSDFPSGSAISYYGNELYIAGDDATQLLVLDSNYNEVRTIPFFNYEGKRIPKAQKADLETAVIIETKGQANLLSLGSAATKEREIAVLLPLHPADSKPQYISYSTFIKRLRHIPEINIEGATIAGRQLILSNRGNEHHPVNHLIITTPDFLDHQEDAAINITPLALPFSLAGFAGVSELCYIEKEDVLLITLSSEATGNAYDDGAIGDSYIAWVNQFSHTSAISEIIPDGIVNLSEVNPAFKGEKIEGICLTAVTDKGWDLHLVSDNDQGASKIFHINLQLANHPVAAGK
jgi:hypothetical protein